jgi:hypothetical protein
MRRRRVWSWLVIAALLGGPMGGCAAGDDRTAQRPSVAPASAPVTVAEVDGASLVRLPVGAGVGYLQRIDVRRMRIDQILGERDAAAPTDPGAYYPGSQSPRFVRIPAVQAQGSCRSRFGSKAFSVVNASFFEEYDRSTRLSFPVKTGGVLISGGSSPWGPVPTPKDRRYRDVRLRALRWDERGVAIDGYDPATGAPLDAPGTREALVSYAFADHPSALVGHDPANRYQLIGVADTDGRDGPEILLVLTVERATLHDGAALLHGLGAVGDIVTVDGGVSTFLWNAAAVGSGPGSVLVPPVSTDGALPHYLCVHAP